MWGANLAVTFCRRVIFSCRLFRLALHQQPGNDEVFIPIGTSAADKAALPGWPLPLPMRESHLMLAAHNLIDQCKIQGRSQNQQKWVQSCTTTAISSSAVMQLCKASTAAAMQY